MPAGFLIKDLSNVLFPPHVVLSMPLLIRSCDFRNYDTNFAEDGESRKARSSIRSHSFLLRMKNSRDTSPK